MLASTGRDLLRAPRCSCRAKCCQSGPSLSQIVNTQYNDVWALAWNIRVNMAENFVGNVNMLLSLDFGWIFRSLSAFLNARKGAPQSHISRQDSAQVPRLKQLLSRMMAQRIQEVHLGSTFYTHHLSLLSIWSSYMALVVVPENHGVRQTQSHSTGRRNGFPKILHSKMYEFIVSDTTRTGSRGAITA